MKNLLRYFLLLMAAGFIFTSCQKELSAETGTSKGALVKDAGGNCSPATPNGTFKKDTALTNNNYVEIQVNITEIGVYFITTDTLNGYSFKGTGVTAVTGANTIRLTGVGKPLAVGVDNFTVKFDGSECDFPINVLDATGGGGGGTSAVYTLGSSTGICNATLNGTFTTGVSSVGNSVTIAISVQTPGSYTLSTIEINGVTFSGSGNLDATTASITLNASGTPSSAGSIFPYALVLSTGGCGFNVPVVAGSGGGAITDSLSATIGGVFKVFDANLDIQFDNTSFPPLNAILISGDSTGSSLEALNFGVGLLTGSVVVNVPYTVNQAPAVFAGGSYFDFAGVEFETLSSTTFPPVIQSNPLTIIFTSISGVIGTAGTRVKGTFTGSFKDNGGAGPGVKTVSGGYFDLTF